MHQKQPPAKVATAVAGGAAGVSPRSGSAAPAPRINSPTPAIAARTAVVARRRVGPVVDFDGFGIRASSFRVFLPG
jgi:hypothetical protein